MSDARLNCPACGAMAWNYPDGRKTCSRCEWEEKPAPAQAAPHVPAAFINALAEEGTREELVKYLQQTWNELCQARATVPQSPTPLSLKDMLKTADDLIGIQEELPDEQDRDVLGRAAHYLRKYAPPTQPQAAQCTCAQAGFPESCDNCDGAHAQRIRNMALDEAAIIAENGCLVPPDGGEPTEAERELCESIALQIRQFKREGAQTRPDRNVPQAAPSDPSDGAIYAAVSRRNMTDAEREELDAALSRPNQPHESEKSAQYFADNFEPVSYPPRRHGVVGGAS